MRTSRRPLCPPNPRRSGASALCAAAVVAALSLTGCSELPDWANPAAWYKRAQSSVTGEEKPQPTPKTTEAEDAKERIDNAPIPGEGEPFPNLASVPPRPAPVTTSGERKDIRQALISDREHAHYIEEGKAPRSEPAPDSDITAAPHAPVTTLAGPIPPPPSAAQPTPAPKGAAEIAQSRPSAPKAHETPAAAPPPPAPAPAPTPTPSQQASAPSAPPAAAETPGAPRALGRLVIEPTGEVKQALPGDGSALSNTAVPPPAAGGLAQGGMSLEPTAIVLFNVNATKLSAQQTNGLKAVADAARKSGGAVRIIGHASPAKSANSTAALVNNFQVAWARAKAVADALTKLGVPPDRLHVEADTSPAAPVAAADLPKGDAGLRRADIFLQ